MSSIPEYSTRFGSTPADSGVTSSLDLYGRGFKLRVYKSEYHLLDNLLVEWQVLILTLVTKNYLEKKGNA